MWDEKQEYVEEEECFSVSSSSSLSPSLDPILFITEQKCRNLEGSFVSEFCVVSRCYRKESQGSECLLVILAPKRRAFEATWTCTILSRMLPPTLAAHYSIHT